MKKAEFNRFVEMFSTPDDRETLYHMGYCWLTLTNKQVDIIFDLAKEFGIYYEIDKTLINGHKYGCIIDCPFMKILI